jgi:hypothetical protein
MPIRCGADRIGELFVMVMLLRKSDPVQNIAQQADSVTAEIKSGPISEF